MRNFTKIIFFLGLFLPFLSLPVFAYTTPADMTGLETLVSSGLAIIETIFMGVLGFVVAYAIFRVAKSVMGRV